LLISIKNDLIVSISFLIVNFVLFVAKLFSSRHKGTKTLRKNNKIKSFVSLCLGGKYIMVKEA